MRHEIAVRGLRGAVASAGVDAVHDEPAHPDSVAVVARAGLGDISGHRSRPVSALLLRKADMVLCMERYHRDAIVSRWPRDAGRARLLGHWQGVEIADPVNGPIDGYEDCLSALVGCISQWLDRLSAQGLT